MDQNTPVQETNAPEVSTETPRNNEYAIIIVVLAVITVVLALMYMWGSRVGTEIPEPMQSTTPAIESSDSGLYDDSVDVIEADLDTADMGDIDAELDALESDLDKELQELPQ